jgi:hypothetical protein
VNEPTDASLQMDQRPVHERKGRSLGAENGIGFARTGMSEADSYEAMVPAMRRCHEVQGNRTVRLCLNYLARARRARTGARLTIFADWRSYNSRAVSGGCMAQPLLAAVQNAPV